jgi:hypothetical protein
MYLINVIPTAVKFYLAGQIPIGFYIFEAN